MAVDSKCKSSNSSILGSPNRLLLLFGVIEIPAMSKGSNLIHSVILPNIIKHTSMLVTVMILSIFVINQVKSFVLQHPIKLKFTDTHL